MQALLTDQQIEEMYGVNRKTLANWRVKGIGPSFVKIGAAVRYRPEDVQAWINSNVYTSTTMYRQRMAASGTRK